MKDQEIDDDGADQDITSTTISSSVTGRRRSLLELDETCISDNDSDDDEDIATSAASLASQPPNKKKRTIADSNKSAKQALADFWTEQKALADANDINGQCMRNSSDWIDPAPMKFLMDAVSKVDPIFMGPGSRLKASLSELEAHSGSAFVISPEMPVWASEMSKGGGMDVISFLLVIHDRVISGLKYSNAECLEAFTNLGIVFGM